MKNGKQLYQLGSITVETITPFLQRKLKKISKVVVRHPHHDDDDDDGFRKVFQQQHIMLYYIVQEAEVAEINRFYDAVDKNI